MCAKITIFSKKWKISLTTFNRENYKKKTANFYCLLQQLIYVALEKRNKAVLAIVAARASTCISAQRFAEYIFLAPTQIFRITKSVVVSKKITKIVLRNTFAIKKLHGNLKLQKSAARKGSNIFR